MIAAVRRPFSLCLGVALVAAALPAPVLAGPAPARLEGFVVGTDGRAAGGHAVLLIDDAGQVADRSTSDPDGLYRFEAVDAGDYGLALELPDGTAVPVPDADGRLRAGQLARRDIRLVPSDGPVSLAPASTHSGLVLWWVGLSPAAKTAIIVGAAAGIWYLLDDDDDRSETPASPFRVE